MNIASINLVNYNEHENQFYYDEQNYSFDHEEVFIDFVNLETACKYCHKIFSSNNKLHYHLWHSRCSKKTIENIKLNVSIFHISSKKVSSKFFKIAIYSVETSVETRNNNIETLKVIESTTSIINLNFEIKFRNSNFLNSLMKFFATNSKKHVCIDTKCETTLKNKQFVKSKCLKTKIRTMTIFLRIKEIDAITHETNK